MQSKQNIRNYCFITGFRFGNSWLAIIRYQQNPNKNISNSCLRLVIYAKQTFNSKQFNLCLIAKGDSVKHL